MTQSEFRGLAAVLHAWMPSSHPTAEPPTGAADSIALAACVETSASALGMRRSLCQG